MKSFGLLILILAFIGSVYFGYIHLVGKAMHSDQKPDLTEFEQLELDHKLKVEEIEKKKKELMEEREQKLKDYRYRH